MRRPGWQQVTIGFADHRDAEPSAVAHVVPILIRAESTRLIRSWFVVRKGTRWRLRYLPDRASNAHTYITGHLNQQRDAGHLTDVTENIYEPEAHAFGGYRAMRTAHRLWHLDSRHILNPTHRPPHDHVRELSILLCTELLRSAGLDWYEQGDVWARITDHRGTAHPDRIQHLINPVRQLLTAAPASLTDAGAPLAAATTWVNAFASAGRALHRLHDSGHLHRGLRDVLTHHIVFAWNRRGIPNHHQATLAATARTVILGTDPTIRTNEMTAA